MESFFADGMEQFCEFTEMESFLFGGCVLFDLDAYHSIYNYKNRIRMILRMDFEMEKSLSETGITKAQWTLLRGENLRRNWGVHSQF